MVNVGVRSPCMHISCVWINVAPTWGVHYFFIFKGSINAAIGLYKIATKENYVFQRVSILIFNYTKPNYYNVFRIK